MQNITLPQLRQLVALTEKRDALLAEVAKIESAISSALAGGSPSIKPSPARRGRKPKGKRGSIKNAILAELKAAGKAGLAVKNLSAKLGLKNQNVHVWFATTGKSVKGLKRLGPGHYALS